MTIGEELESRFFKVLSCVSDILSCPDLPSQRLLTSGSYAAGACRSMRPNVAGCRCWNSAAVNYWQDVFRTLLRYEFVPRKKTWRERGWRRTRVRRFSAEPCVVRCDRWLSQFWKALQKLRRWLTAERQLNVILAECGVSCQFASKNTVLERPESFRTPSLDYTIL